MKTKTKLDTKMKIKTILLVAAAGLVVMIITQCGGGAGINPNVHIPDMDQTQYNDYYYTVGWKDLKEGKMEEAVKNFGKSSLGQEKILVGYGYAYLAKNKLELARTAFEKCLKINPENFQAQFGMATMYELIKDNDRAFRIYAKLRAAYPDDVWVKNRFDFLKSTETQNYLKQAEKFKAEKNMQEYIRMLETVSDYSPEMVNIKVEIADYYVSRDQFDKAAPYYEKALEKTPDSEDILMKLAGVYEKTGKHDSAILIYKKMQELKPGDPTIPRKIEELKVKFNELKMPEKFKNIFFKETINREELAALIGYYFDKYFEPRQPLIITDIGTSFAKEYIIKVCALEIMQLRPDHSFDRYSTVNRAAFAVVMDALLKYLEKAKNGAYSIRFTPVDKTVEPADISPLHKYYDVIKFLVNSGMIKLDADNNFDPTREVSPTEVLTALQKILNSLPLPF